jgi:undecaprenyl-diphosphatase
MDWLQVTVLAVVQGLTEFLPISSSGHLILAPAVLGWEDQGLAFDVATHVGTLAAVILYFRRELAAMVRDGVGTLRTGEVTPQSRLAWFVILGTVPVAVAGLVFRDVIATELRSPLVLGVALIGFGLLLGVADWVGRRSRDEYSLGWRGALTIGLVQALSLIPGTSRSGVTMTAALLLGLTREGAARFSFLLSIPVTALAGGYETLKLIRAAESVDWPPLFAGALIAGIAAYLCIHYFLAFIRRIGMQPFVLYRLALGAVILWVFWPGS